jgi:hypothetical protein
MDDQNWIVAEGSEDNQSAFAVGVTKITIDRILRLNTHRADALALYLFYAYTARWKNTNEIWANNQYAAKSLSWGVDKVRRVRQILLDLGLIEAIHQRGERGRMTRPLVRVNYLVRPADQSLNLPVVVKSAPNEEVQVPLKKNSTVARILRASSEKIYAAYPRKVGKPIAITAIIKALGKTTFDHLMNAAQAYAKVCADLPANRRQFSPYPATWFNQERYNDGAKEWVLATKVESKSPVFAIQKQITACTDQINKLWRDNKFFVKGSNGQKLDVPTHIRQEIAALRTRRDEFKKQLTK